MLRTSCHALGRGGQVELVLALGDLGLDQVPLSHAAVGTADGAPRPRPGWVPVGCGWRPAPPRCSSYASARAQASVGVDGGGGVHGGGRSDVDAMRSLFSLVGSSRGCSASHLISKSKHHGITKASGYNLWRRHPIVAPFCARWPPQVAHEGERGGTIPANRDSNVALCCVRFFCNLYLYAHLPNTHTRARSPHGQHTRRRGRVWHRVPTVPRTDGAALQRVWHLSLLLRRVRGGGLRAVRRARRVRAAHRPRAREDQPGRVRDARPHVPQVRRRPHGQVRGPRHLGRPDHGRHALSAHAGRRVAERDVPQDVLWHRLRAVPRLLRGGRRGALPL